MQSIPTRFAVLSEDLQVSVCRQRLFQVRMGVVNAQDSNYYSGYTTSSSSLNQCPTRDRIGDGLLYTRTLSIHELDLRLAGIKPRTQCLRCKRISKSDRSN